MGIIFYTLVVGTYKNEIQKRINSVFKMKTCFAFVVLSFLTVGYGHPEDPKLQACLQETKTDQKLFDAFVKGSNDNLDNLLEFFKCSAKAKEFVIDGKVKLDGFEEFAKGHEAATNQLKICKTLPVPNDDKTLIEFSKCLRDVALKKPQNK
ncbi:hypothetical protein FQR65_LT01824 [Abscondita terminalis]|nr:hypothetical protein FQR65_LT01824 [Abscondita terminalis]